MMNRVRLGVGVVVLVACGARPDPGPGATWPKSTDILKVTKSELSAQAATCLQPSCPNALGTCALSEMICPNGTTNCCQPNGSGIYTDEGGSAGIGEIGLTQV